MIDGEPRIVECDGQRQLVDATGEHLICRRRSSATHGCFHRIDLDRYSQTGDIRPRCEHVTGHDDDRWVLRRRQSLTDVWDGCRYAGCYGDEETTITRETGQQLATTLKELSPEEFEVAASDHQTTTNAGESV